MPAVVTFVNFPVSLRRVSPFLPEAREALRFSPAFCRALGRGTGGQRTENTDFLLMEFCLLPDSLLLEGDRGGSSGEALRLPPLAAASGFVLRPLSPICHCLVGRCLRPVSVLRLWISELRTVGLPIRSPDPSLRRIARPDADRKTCLAASAALAS